jgi:hypothetical protein
MIDSSTLLDTPVVTGSVPQSFVIEALGGPQQPKALLDRFPEEVYNKAPESHFLRFMYVLLGPAGTGLLRRNYLQARLILEAHGLETFDLDAFYGDPLSFGRVLDEQYDDDTEGLIDHDTWEKIKARDAAYRSRAMDFLSAARLGNTVQGMRLASKSGLGHDVEIIENYRYLYDHHSDLPVGHSYYGTTPSTQEWIVVPRQDVSKSCVQTIKILGSPTGGSFTLTYNGRTTTSLTYNAATVGTGGIQPALEALADIGEGNVLVQGEFPTWTVTFIGALSGREVPTFIPNPSLTGGTSPTMEVDVNQGGLDASNEVVTLAERDLHHLQVAIDRLRPVNTVPTMTSGQGRRARQVWGSVTASSFYQEILRFVTGNQAVSWPAVDSRHWIVKSVEKEAPRPFTDLRSHYRGYHNPVDVTATSERVGGFAEQGQLIPLLGEIDAQNQNPPVIPRNVTPITYTADRALADYPEQPVPTPEDTVLNIYPSDYSSLPGVPTIKYSDEQFWSSTDRLPGTSEELVIDLGSAQAINYLAFETILKPVNVSVFYDNLDDPTTRRWVEVTSELGSEFPSYLIASPQASAWTFLEFHFTNVKTEIPFSRYVRIVFDRREGDAFLFDAVNETQIPWSIEVRNLRVARNVS